MCGESEAVSHLLVLAARVFGRGGLLIERVATQAVGVNFGGAQSESIRTRSGGASGRRSIGCWNSNAATMC